MWARVQQGLDRRPRVSLFGTWLSKNDTRGRFLLPAAGLAAAVVVAVLVAGRFSPKGRQTTATAPGPAVTSATASETRSRERVLLSALDSHFQQSEMLLVEVMNAPAAGYDNFGFERETADDLLGSSRLYRATAELNGNVSSGYRGSGVGAGRDRSARRKSSKDSGRCEPGSTATTCSSGTLSQTIQDVSEA
jgi:hypothetical protein